MKKINIVIAGATGFIGSNLIQKLVLSNQFYLIGLSRSKSVTENGVEWRKCDGFKFNEVVSALRECDILVYLIHSMIPTSELVQGAFEDYDALVAHNFALSVNINQVKKVIYLGGLLPSSYINLSTHLSSRFEVERILALCQSALIVLRAGLIIGPQGSSFTILERLVNRLPVLICPTWTNNRMHPIGLEDLLRQLEILLNQNEVISNTYDIGMIDSVTYRDLLKGTADVYQKKRLFISIPIFSQGLSKYWVRLITGISKELVYPLIESLKHEMIVDESRRLFIKHYHTPTVKAALQECVISSSKEIVSKKSFAKRHSVTSIQRVKNLHKYTSLQVAELYGNWLVKFFKNIISVKDINNKIIFSLFEKIILLELVLITSQGDDIVRFKISSGILVNKSFKEGVFEFRAIKDINIIIIGIYDFVPSLPWVIYKYTQALVHLWVMKKFSNYLNNFGCKSR